MSAPVVGPNRLPDLTHVAVSLESSSYSDEDFFAFAVLNSLMGGGGSFSAGGPGKGMYTQLYLRVLNQYHWVYHAQALNHAYSDSGTFCLFGSTHPQKVIVSYFDFELLYSLLFVSVSWLRLYRQDILLTFFAKSFITWQKAMMKSVNA